MCGVQLLWKTPVLGVGSNGVKLEGRTVPARWVIGADGGSSRVRKWIGLEAGARNTMRFATRRHYRVRPWSEYMEIYWGHETQAYVTPISPEEVCVVIMAETKWASGFDSALRDQPHLRERLKGAELASRERGAVSEALRLKHVFRGNVALLGDASGSVDAITGEGLRLAFRQSAILAEAMRRGDLASYAVAHQRLARRPLWMGSLMLQFGKRAGLRERTMRILAKRPELFTRLLSIHLGHARPRHILSTGAKLGWQFLTATEPS
jgi:flavin-dependent dehydrogenase